MQDAYVNESFPATSAHNQSWFLETFLGAPDPARQGSKKQRAAVDRTTARLSIGTG